MSIDFGNDIYEEPIVAKTFLAEDAQESSLRPKTLAEYIGQEKAKENLSIFIQAARKRQESLDHVLLHGRSVFYGHIHSIRFLPETQAGNASNFVNFS